MARTGYKAVVETGWSSKDYRRMEEARDCGHLHRTPEAASDCGERLYNARYVRGSWTANAAWHGYAVHNQDGERLPEEVAARLEERRSEQR